MNEVLAKCVAHNPRCVVKAIFTAEVDELLAGQWLSARVCPHLWLSFVTA